MNWMKRSLARLGIEEIRDMTPAEIEWLRDHACKLAHGMGDPAEYIPWKAADEIERLTRQLAETQASLAESRRHAGVELSEENDRLIDQLAEAREVREKITAMYELALSQGDDAAIGLSHALDVLTAAQVTTIVCPTCKKESNCFCSDAWHQAMGY